MHTWRLLIREAALCTGSGRAAALYVADTSVPRCSQECRRVARGAADAAEESRVMERICRGCHVEGCHMKQPLVHLQTMYRHVKQCEYRQRTT